MACGTVREVSLRCAHVGNPSFACLLLAVGPRRAHGGLGGPVHKHKTGVFAWRLGRPGRRK